MGFVEDLLPVYKPREQNVIQEILQLINFIAIGKFRFVLPITLKGLFGGTDSIAMYQSVFNRIIELLKETTGKDDTDYFKRIITLKWEKMCELERETIKKACGKSDIPDEECKIWWDEFQEIVELSRYLYP